MVKVLDFPRLPRPPHPRLRIFFFSANLELVDFMAVVGGVFHYPLSSRDTYTNGSISVINRSPNDRNC